MYGLKRNRLKDNHQIDSEFDRGAVRMRKFTASKLSKILKEHKRWHDTDKKEGKRADLSGAQLGNAKLSGANLSDAISTGT